MPIKKILVSEEMIKKIETEQSGKNTTLFIAVPAGTAPENVGEYVLKEVLQSHPTFTVASSTGTTISFVAQQGAKEGWGLRGVKVSLFPPNVEFDWGKNFIAGNVKP
jgi:hypothetical protein